MAERRSVSPVRPEESATTREEMNFDDTEGDISVVSPVAENHPSTTQPPAASPSPKPRVQFSEEAEEIPPSKPPRPVNAMLQAENTLIEAFPTIDPKVVKAVLMASGGQVEPAFNALLGMSDPDYQAETPAPPQPPRPTQRQPLSQMEADELYARQLAEQYSEGSRTQNRYNQREPGRRGPNQQRPNYYEEENERSFFDDDLPEIGRNIQQGFLDTQKKVNSWISNFKKRLDGEPEEDDLYSSSSSQARPGQGAGGWQGRQNFGASQAEQLQGIRKMGENQRRSTEAQRYDADPHEFGEDEFERLELRDDEAPPPQPLRTSSRRPVNPDLFKSQPPLPPNSGPVDEVDAAERKMSGKNASDAEKSKKWQPLTSVAPYPEDDNDPFSLGDDDEERDKTEDLRKDDTERLKNAARNSVSEASGTKPLQENETSGSAGVKDKDAEELLKGKK